MGTGRYAQEHLDSIKATENLHVVECKTDSAPCELCQKPAPHGHKFCYSCVWKTRWPEHILNFPEIERRQKRSHLTNLILIEKDIPEALFQGSAKKPYVTHLNSCTCRDFTIGHENYPCKHIFRLATELGLFSPKKFQEGEDDYVMHPGKTFNEHLKPEPEKGVFSGMTVVFTGKLLSGTRTASEIRVRAFEGRVSTVVDERTSLVVAGENAGKRKSSKLSQAESLGVKIIDENEFLSMCASGDAKQLEEWQVRYPSVKIVMGNRNA